MKKVSELTKKHRNLVYMLEDAYINDSSRIVGARTKLKHELARLVELIEDQDQSISDLEEERDRHKAQLGHPDDWDELTIEEKLLWIFDHAGDGDAKDLADDALQEIKDLRIWIDDLQSGMYINCVYCGHRYGPDDEVPATMAQALKGHIEVCPKHPMSKLKEINRRLLDIFEWLLPDLSFLSEDKRKALLDKLKEEGVR